MKKHEADVARRELIGLQVRIESPDGGLDGLEGRIVDETKHTFLVETPGPQTPGSGSQARTKRVPKMGNRFVFRVGTNATRVGEVVIDGADIMFQPEDRTKKVRG